MNNLEKIKDLYENFIHTGRLIEGFDKYYAEDVSTQELGEEARIGKNINRERWIKFLEQVEEFHRGSIINLGSDETQSQTFVESWMEVTFKGGEKKKLQQVSVQSWRRGKIVDEFFYH
jgi:hypothetical protein